MLIQIRQMSQLRPDDRGPAIGVEIRSCEYIVVLRRNKDTISGSHYHKGLCLSKNPEIFYLVSGTAQIFAKSIKNDETEEHIVGPDTLIEIPPMVYHEVRALTDIILLELNTHKEDFREDTFYLEDHAKSNE